MQAAGVNNALYIWVKYRANAVGMHYTGRQIFLSPRRSEFFPVMETSLTERATWRDYYELCKPNVVWLMILTAIVGMCMATTGAVDPRCGDLCQSRHCAVLWVSGRD
jgi:heme O synthase-like polyprenyltransferase